MRFRLVESKEDRQRFIDKFGKEVFDNFWSSRQLLKNMGVNADITWHTKHTDVDTMKKLLQRLADERQNKIDVDGERIPDPNGNYDVVYQDNEWTVYHPKDYISSIHCANGARWCTAGGYEIPSGQVKVSQARKYFNEYTEDGVQLFYYIRKNGERYALAMQTKDNYEIYDEDDSNIDFVPGAPKVKGLPDIEFKPGTIYKYIGGWNELDPYPKDKSDIEKVVVQDGTTHIGSALSGCYNLLQVDIPDSVKSIGDRAFRGCGKLTEVNLPSHLDNLGSSAFSYCSSLQTITIPDGIKEINYKTFYECENLRSVNLPNTLTEIDTRAFSKCVRLTSIIIPKSVDTVGFYAFHECNNLSNITLNSGLHKIDENAFSKCVNLKSVIIPDSVISIGRAAFWNCNGLERVKLSSSLNKIDESTFAFCNSLTDIVVPNGVTAIEQSAFRMCASLADILIPSSVTSIGEDAFLGVDTLTIHCNKGSYAEQYAQENNIPVKYI